MRSKIPYALAGVLTILALLVTSCSSGNQATQTTQTTTTKATTTQQTSEKPKYGGTLTLIEPVPFQIFSPVVTAGRLYDNLLMGYVHEQYTNGDWALGPAGTGEAFYGDLGLTSITNWKFVKGLLLESFETPDLFTWVMNVRKGVHFGLNPNNPASVLANGREVTADDVVWSINMMATNPKSGMLLRQPSLSKNLTVTKTGDWQVTLKTPQDNAITYNWIMGGGGAGSQLYAKEVVEQYGSTNDWRQLVGTGPYMVSDYIDQNSMSLIRNPNYWQKNPVGPGKGDQLPYPDGLKILFVPDFSTRLALMRAGNADRIEGIYYDDAKNLANTNPNLKSSTYLPVAPVISLRTDKAPYNDKRVRQALMLALDYNSFVKDYYQGHALALATPVAPVKGTENIYWPIDTLPDAAKTLFSYNPAKAKQLLADAGFPNGLKCKLLVQASTPDVDEAQALKTMWAKAGIDVELQVREAAVYAGIFATRSYDEMEFRALSDQTAFSTRYAFTNLRGGTGELINDPPGNEPRIEATFQEMQKTLWVDVNKSDKVLHDFLPYLLEQAYNIPRPTPYLYRFWQPWLKNYYGEAQPKYWIPYAWMDQDLKAGKK